MLELVMNELSFRQPNGNRCAAPDVHIAREWMSQLTGTIRTARQMGFGTTIRTERGFSGQELSPGYFLPQWRNDLAVNRDERILFSSMTAKSPHLDGVLDEVAETAELAEVFISGLQSAGLLATLLIDAIAVSWASHETWNTHLLMAQLRQLSIDGELIQNDVQIRHASVPEHWAHHRAWIEQEQMASVSDGEDLWAKSPELFPYLEFCGKSETQIRALTGSEKHFAWVVRCLTLANVQCSRWTVGPFPHFLLPGPATGESISVHNNRELRDLRVFRMLSGQWQMFEHHMKNNSENKRIHYLADHARRRLCIAYVGDHLPTAQY
jgi:hypothetical protein